MRQRILVTGGAGFIGSHLVEHLLADGGFDVTVLDDFDDFYDPEIKRRNIEACAGNPRFRLVDGGIRDDALIDRLVGERPDVVVHLAARAGVRPSIRDPLLYEDVNVRGTLVILEAMRRHARRRLVFASSSSVYGATSRAPFREDDPADRPISPYAATKRAGELLLATYHHLYGIESAALRFFTVYGPRQRPEMAIARFSRLILEGEPVPVFGDGTMRRDFTWIEDIIQGVRAAIDRVEGRGFQVYNLGESETTTLIDLVRLIEEAAGRPARIDWRPPEPGDVPLTSADIDKARRELGYHPRTPIREGIRKYVAWLKGERR